MKATRKLDVCVKCGDAGTDPCARCGKRFCGMHNRMSEGECLCWDCEEEQDEDA